MMEEKTVRRSRRPVSPRVTIEVQQGTIDNAIRRDDVHCMISEAIHQQLPLAKNISTDLATIRFTDPVKRLRYVYLTPKAAQIALIDFDRGVKPAPFSLSLARAAQIVRGGGGRRLQPKSKEEKREADKRRQQLRRQLVSTNPDQEFNMSKEHRDAVMDAMDDPKADLGPATVHYAPGDNKKTSIPVVIGGKAPVPGNLGRSRRFGLRQLME